MSSNKRGNIFGQGRPEQPYDERDEPADVPQKATAAQLAARKIKTAKARRPAGASSNLAQSANFGAQQSNNFNFGASAPAPASNGANGFGGFGASSAFGGSTTTSFPPAQPVAPSNTFSNSSFPAFGASNESSAFQPPSSSAFNFTAGAATPISNPFANASSAPATNGSTPAPAFGGSSIFNSAPSQSNPFGGLSQTNTTSSASSGGMFGTSSAAPGGMFGASSAAPSGNTIFGASSAAPSGGSMFGTSSATTSGGMFGAASGAPSGGMFGTSSAAPSGSMFGTTSGAPNATSTPAPAATPFTFGAASTSAQNTESTPATSGFFGKPAQSPAPAAANNIFSGFGAGTPQSETPKAPAAPQNMFAGFGSNAQKSESSTETPKQGKLFGEISTGAQGTSNGTSTAPAPSMFNFTASTPKADNATSTPSSSNPFASLPTPATPSTPFSGFGATSSTPQAQEKAPATSTNLFGSLKTPKASDSTEMPKSNPFGGLAQPSSTPAASNSSFSLFGTTQDKQDAGAATAKAPEAPKSTLFQPFSTPQPAKKAEAEKSQGGLFSAAQPKTSSGMFSQSFQPETNNASDLFKKPQSGFPSFTPTTTSSTEAPKAAAAPTPASKDSTNPFASLSTPSADRPNLFGTPKEPAQASPAPAMPNLTGDAATSNGESQTPEMPKVPKVHVPKEWAIPGAVRVQSSDALLKQISDLTAQLHVLNEKYRQQLSILPPTADWSSVSLWHYQHATDIKKKIDNAKKQRAVARGVTGYESSLSTKRKVDAESPEIRDSSPTKRAREAPASPTPQKSNPTATATANMFAKAIGNKPSTPAAQSSTSLFAPKPNEKPTAEPASTASGGNAFGFTPSAPATDGDKTPAASSGFKPSFGGDSSSKSDSTGFKPNFGSGSTSASGSSGFKPSFGAPPASGGGFMAQFQKTAKTYEQLAAERKKKAMDEDYDSDDETKEEWSARYDKAEAERLAEEKKKIAAAPTFTVPEATAPSAAKPATPAPGSTSPKSNPFSGLLKPASGTSTPGLSTPKAASPVPSTGSQSIFKAPSSSQTPTPNIFGHLSPAPSSNHQDESDEDDNEDAGSAEPATPPKAKFGESETESEDTQELKQDAAPKGSLLSRITRGTDSGSEKGSTGSTPLFGNTNGTTTPTNKPFTFFNFDAASKTAPPKSDTFGGDQTFKAGTPIKFGQAPATEKKGGLPQFSFSPSTPSPAEFSTTPAKAPPSIFNFSSANSVTSSVFSSRAGTPLSEAGETSAASAAEDEEEGDKQEQIDLSQLTEEETKAFDIVFHTEVALAKHQVNNAWTNIARGPMWILKDKETGKCCVRVRLASGATPLNYQILPSLPATVTGASKKMVMATRPAKEGGLQSLLFAVKTPEIAAELAAKYTESLP
ncbi:hypothetical protein PTT_19648 [Pyrenophora teres f. teres 0-1]|uniref:Uncharacterized protein n=1 Tax=Pyrenophora teres f. teres (strain 0-1) TaxID=861557 RepID=E3S9E1_PYRTT|nr:hypothetical protein PTT_19648 [Pyrenophora teres f. teres 0-1]